MSDIRIDHGVEMPEGNRPTGDRKYPWPDMMVGDSFFVPVGPEQQYKNVASALYGSAHYYRKTSVHKRFQISVRGVEGGIRVWRVR